ncbi:MAG: SigE family RNA polymerase sigma factor [Actinobacteria bacterium]|nr:SigE family RNA polymerase sigma factor [Actinomycetota bacterium]
MSAAEFSMAAALEPGLTFEHFVALHGRSLGGFALMITGNAADAQDAVQDALIGAYSRWDRIVDNGDPLAYIRRSIVNRHISVHRKLRRLVALGDRQGAVADPAPDLVGRHWALHVIARLPARQRVAVVLRVIEDQDFGVVADALGVSPANARKIVSRGLATLRSLLDEEGKTDGR